MYATYNVVCKMEDINVGGIVVGGVGGWGVGRGVARTDFIPVFLKTQDQ